MIYKWTIFTFITIVLDMKFTSPFDMAVANMATPSNTKPLIQIFVNENNQWDAGAHVLEMSRKSETFSDIKQQQRSICKTNISITKHVLSEQRTGHITMSIYYKHTDIHPVDYILIVAGQRWPQLSILVIWTLHSGNLTVCSGKSSLNKYQANLHFSSSIFTHLFIFLSDYLL